MVTHHLHFAKESDHVVFMHEGEIAAQGTFSELEKMNFGLLNVFKIEASKKSSEGDIKPEVKEEKKKLAGDGLVAKSADKGGKEEPAQVTWGTYKDYLTTTGTWKRFLSIAVLYIVPHLTHDILRKIDRSLGRGTNKIRQK